MKRIALFISVTFILVSCSVQHTVSNNENYTNVRVKDWSTKSFLFAEQFWEGKKEQIEKQMGAGAFEKVKKYSDWHNLPAAMSIFDGNKKKELDEYYKKLDGLKGLHKVASFDHFFQGKNWGEYVVIEVPYKGNESWEPGVKWDTAYFILEAKSVEIL